MGAAEAGNYKGVMLCNRPTEPTSYGAGVTTITPASDAPSFRPVGLPAEPLGLNPAKENLVSNVLAVHDEAARRRAEQGGRAGPPNFMSKHRQWLSEMAKKKAALNAELQASAMAAEEKRKKFVAYSRPLRDAVRERAAEMDVEGVPHSQPELNKGSRLPPPEEEASEQEELQRFLKESAEPPMPKPKKAAASSSSKAATRPAWALTEDQADELEDEEANELLEFAAGLDYDAYVDDLEVRQALSVIRERIDAQKAAEAAAAAVDEAEEKIAAAGGDWRSQFVKEWNGDDDGASTRTGASRRTAGREVTGGDEAKSEKPEWDSSTNAGDRDRGSVNTSARAMAEELMRENPELAAKHSVKSLSSVVTKRLAGTAPMFGDDHEQLPPLRVVTVVENPKVETKQIDASNLPYLHRNPAV